MIMGGGMEIARLGNHMLIPPLCALLVLSVALVASSRGTPISAARPDLQDEVILARQGLMEAVSGLLNEGEAPENDEAAAAMQANAEAVALSLPALKFLFPAETNPSNSNFKASYRTYALPAIWANFDKFSNDLDASVAAAHALENSRDPAKFPALARRVLETCEACHAEFRAPFESPFDAK
jgi:cytochrome c556